MQPHICICISAIFYNDVMSLLYLNTLLTPVDFCRVPPSDYYQLMNSIIAVCCWMGCTWPPLSPWSCALSTPFFAVCTTSHVLYKCPVVSDSCHWLICNRWQSVFLALQAHTQLCLKVQHTAIFWECHILQWHSKMSHIGMVTLLVFWHNAYILCPREYDLAQLTYYAALRFASRDL